MLLVVLLAFPVIGYERKTFILHQNIIGSNSSVNLDNVAYTNESNYFISAQSIGVNSNTHFPLSLKPHTSNNYVTRIWNYEGTQTFNIITYTGGGIGFTDNSMNLFGYISTGGHIDFSGTGYFDRVVQGGANPNDNGIAGKSLGLEINFITDCRDGEVDINVDDYHTTIFNFECDSRCILYLPQADKKRNNLHNVKNIVSNEACNEVLIRIRESGYFDNDFGTKDLRQFESVMLHATNEKENVWYIIGEYSP